VETHVFNLYSVTNLRELRTSYRLVDVDGISDSIDRDLAERNLSLLGKRIAYQDKCPVSILRLQDKSVLAIPAATKLTKREYDLPPDVAVLSPREETHELAFEALTPETEGIALSFLGFHLRSPLRRKAGLWSPGGSSFFSKTPVNHKDARREVDVFGGFGFRVIRLDGGMYLSLWLTYKYADSQWLLERFTPDQIHGLKMRHMLYFYGDRMFPVQFVGLTGKTVASQEFKPEHEDARITVFTYTHREVGQRHPWTRAMRPDSPAISFRHPGNEKRRFGAAALCKLLLPTNDPRVSPVHGMSMRPPDARFRAAARLIEKHFSGVALGDIPVRISATPLREPAKVFPVPKVEFGQGKLLRVGQNRKAGEVSLEALGRTRMACLLGADGGIAAPSTLDPQYFFVPGTCERPIAEDFQQRLENMVSNFLRGSYHLEMVVYDNTDARTLKDQVDAIRGALEAAELKSGHGVLMLPYDARKDLHNFIKRDLYSRLQVQCVDATRVREFYDASEQGGKKVFLVPDTSERDYRSYLQHAAMGVLLVNRQFPWVLKNGTRHDVYVGVDVLNYTAAFTFFYDGGRRCFVRTEPTKQAEKLLRAQVATIVEKYLTEDLLGCGSPPRSIVMRRDGRGYHAEWLGFRDAIRSLIRKGILPKDTKFGVVEVYKESARGLRLVLDEGEGRLRNPTIGAWRGLNDCEGIVCTTGQPFQLRGTVKPLLVRVTYGDLDIEWVLQDTFDMSQLCWPAPTRFIRLPIDLKFCDDFLRSIAASADEEEAMYGEESADDEDEGSIPAINYGN
jgi:hypothetical protein